MIQAVSSQLINNMNHLIYSPLEQFEVNVLFPLTFFRIFDIAITNSTIYQFLSFSFFTFFFLISSYRLTIIPKFFQIVIEMVYEFIFDIIKNQSSLKGQSYFPIFFLIFGFVLFSNLIGLTPFAFTPTSHIIINFMIALSMFIGFLILGFLRQGISFLNLFVPSGVPVALLPLLVCIEIMSVFLRPISLSVRLFANMLAGHTLLHILAGFVISLLSFGIFVGFFPFLILVAVMVLEFGIAFLQAYVFIVLLAIYLNDSIQINH